MILIRHDVDVDPEKPLNGFGKTKECRFAFALESFLSIASTFIINIVCRLHTFVVFSYVSKTAAVVLFVVSVCVSSSSHTHTHISKRFLKSITFLS